MERGGYASGEGGLEKDIAVAAAAAALCARCARRPSSSSRVGCSSTTPTNVLQPFTTTALANLVWGAECFNQLVKGDADQPVIQPYYSSFQEATLSISAIIGVSMACACHPSHLQVKALMAT